MQQINCYIPIKLRITGRLSDAQLDQLSETIVRALAARISFAQRTIASHNGNHWLRGDVELVREAHDPLRADIAASEYSLPSYDRNGKRRQIPVKNRARKEPAEPTGSSAPGGSPAAESPTPPSTGGPKGILDGVTIRTYADVAAFCRTRAAALAAERDTILGEGVPAPTALRNAQHEGEQLAAMAKAGGNLEVDDVTFEQTDQWFSTYTGAMSAGEATRAGVAAQKLREVRIVSENAKANNERMAAQVADKQRDAFVKGDETRLSKLWDWSTNLYDSILDFAPVIEEARKMEQSLAAMAQAGPNVGRVGRVYKLPEASTLLPLVQKVNKAIAVIQLVQASADLVSGGKTTSAKARTAVKSFVAIASSAETLIGMAGPLGLLLNLHIGPMTDACLGALSKLESVARGGNKDLIELGQYDRVNWNLEPGGPGARPLFDFMLAVMAAQSPESVPTPMPSRVASYFVENRSDIEAGATGGKKGDELPTTGSWFWSEVDQKKIAQWVFNHRRNLWAMFYGSAKPNVNA